MANDTGSIEIDFGAAPGSVYANVAVTGQSGIVSTSNIEAFMMVEASTDHVAANHIVAAALIKFSCGDIVDGVGFTIHAVAEQALTGLFKVRWVWAD